MTREVVSIVMIVFVTVVAIVAAVDSYMEKKGKDLVPDDNLIEEAAENIIRKETGLDIDFSPDSPEL